MAFTFDSNPLSGSMNSYVSTSYADDYFVARFGAEAWADLDDSQKQALLVTATNLLDTFVYGGLRTSKTQPLQWPRQGIYNDEGYLYPNNVLPAGMLKATCEQALWLLQEQDRVLPDITLSQVDSFKAGPLDVTVKKGAPTMSPDVVRMISSIGQGVLINTGDSGKKTSMSINL